MSLAPRLALLLGTLAILALVGEGAARIMAKVRSASPTQPQASVAAGPTLIDVMDLAKPNVRGIHQGVPYRTNAKGIRGPEYTLQPSEGTFRILIVGDSVTMGWAVTEEQTYTEVLERMLNASSGDPAAPDSRHPERRFEVINAGLAGVNAEFSNRRIRKFGEIYRPDLTIYGFTLNDIEGPSYRKIPREDRKALSQTTWRRALRFHDSSSYLLRELWPRLIMALEWDVFYPAEAIWIAPQASEWDKNYFENAAAWGDFTLALDVHAEAAREWQTCGHVLIHTYLQELSPEHRYREIYDRVADAALARDLSVTRSLDLFLGRDKTELWVNAFDVHPNARGHELLARALYEGLRALPPECWNTRAERRARTTPRDSRSSAGAR